MKHKFRYTIILFYVFSLSFVVYASLTIVTFMLYFAKTGAILERSRDIIYARVSTTKATKTLLLPLNM